MASSFVVRRWYCQKCDNRIVPYDSYESLTEIPRGEEGKGPILLTSLNAKNRYHALAEGKTPSAIGWCWTCNKFTSGYQPTRMDLVKRYLQRDGIQIRTSHRGLRARIEELIDRAS